MVRAHAQATVSIEDFAGALASRSPVPGGGSCAAVILALSAALVAMSAQFTIGRRRFRSVQPVMDRLITETESIRTEALDLIETDACTYTQLVDAYKMPRESPEEIAARDRCIAEAALAASEVPATVARFALAVIGLAELAIENGNPHLRSDAAAGACLARSVIQICQMNIRANIGLVNDKSSKADLGQTWTDIAEGLPRADAAVAAALAIHSHDG